jgi:uncharacterized protein
MKTNTLNNSNSRIDVIDALRGFALLGILFSHITELYVGDILPDNVYLYSGWIKADGIAMLLVVALFRAKSFMIFSFLFGLSFYIQMERGKAKGIDFKKTYIWRIILLLFIGLLHQVIYRGDILILYALLAFPLMLFFKMNSNRVFITLIISILFIPKLLIGLADYYELISIPSLSNDARSLYIQTLLDGSFWDIGKLNLTQGMLSKLYIHIGPYSRIFQTFALFLAGLAFGKSGIIEALADRVKTLRKFSLWSTVASVILLTATLFFFYLSRDKNFGFLPFDFMYDITNVALTAFYISTFLWLFHASKNWIIKLLANFGRTALSNYIGQSIIGAILFYSYGFGLLKSFLVIELIGIGCIIAIVQLALSTIWLKYFYYGPLEWLWRCATYFKWQKMIR